MSNTLDANLNVIAENDAIEIQTLDGDISFISKLGDEPNDVDGMTSAQLKAEFDKAGNVIKEYLNEKLVPAILAEDATQANRTAAEKERAENELARAEAETARENAEAARIQTEAARVLAEGSRADAEAARVQAESSRADAEAARVQAEQARVDENAGIVAQATAQANAAAASANASAGSASASAQSAGDAAASQQAALASQNAAALSAAASEQSNQAAAGQVTAAQSWAEGGTGTREGEDTANAKYWASRAEAFAGGGVTTFNGRKGDVKPQGGDYSYYMTFAAADWSEDNTITIPAETHGLTGTAVFAQAMCLKNGAYQGNTWVGICTWASIAEDGTITVHSPDGPYDGAVLIIC